MLSRCRLRSSTWRWAVILICWASAFASAIIRWPRCTASVTTLSTLRRAFAMSDWHARRPRVGFARPARLSRRVPQHLRRVLGLGHQLLQKVAATAASWREGAAARPLRGDAIRTPKSDSSRRWPRGSPRAGGWLCLAALGLALGVGEELIAVGTARVVGLVLRNVTFGCGTQRTSPLAWRAPRRPRIGAAAKPRPRAPPTRVARPLPVAPWRELPWRHSPPACGTSSASRLAFARSRSTGSRLRRGRRVNLGLRGWH